MTSLKNNLSRRRFNTGVLAGTLTSTSTTLHASNLDVANESDSLSLLDVPQSLEAHVATLFGTQPIVRSGITLKLPALAENGNSVALSIETDQRRSQQRIQKLYLFAEKNPLPDIARFEFAEPMDKQSIDLRVRLADSQTILAVAQTNDGTLLGDHASIVVTIAACIDIPI